MSDAHRLQRRQVGERQETRGQEGRQEREHQAQRGELREGKIRQPEKEVINLLGEPTETKNTDGGKGKQLIWKSGMSSAQVDITDGKVSGKQSAIVDVKPK